MSQNPLLQKPGAVKAAYEAMRVESKKALVGQDEVFEQMVIALLARGHVLLEGVPGTAKTLAAKILALSDAQLGQRLHEYKQRLVAELVQADEEVRR